MKKQSILGVALGLSTLGLLANACGGGPAAFGASCALEDASSCENGFVCGMSEGEDPVCVIAPGQTCDPSDGLFNNGCQADGVCAEAPGSSGSGMAGDRGDPEYVCLLGEGATCDPEEPFCDDDLTCAELTSGDYACFGRVVMRGVVTDTSDASAIEAAHVLALDEEGAAVTDVAISEMDGTYLLDIPVLRKEDGSPVKATFTLQGSAQDYQAFPKGARVALPISTTEVESEGRKYVIESALTDLGLIPLEAGERTMITGSLVGLDADSQLAGTLVVAAGDAGAFSAIADLSGEFTIFNVPDGDFVVSAYGAGIQVPSEDVTVSGKPVEDVELGEVEDSTTAVSGNINIVNAPGGSVTSVILVVEDTFDEDAARGEVPRGLRAPETGPVSIDGDFTIEGVPAGRYVVLAAYENDDLVRDPDTGIAGTGFVHIEVTAGETEFTVGESFKVTEALEISSPGMDEPEAVTEKPLLVWADDSSEDYYQVRVFDAFGEEVWSVLDVPGVSGSSTVELQYEGPLDPGMYYQFRASSWRQSGGGDPSPISMTEDLRGVFFLPAK